MRNRALRSKKITGAGRRTASVKIIFIKKVTDDEFCFTVRAALSDALVSWVISFGDRVKVLSPERLRDMTVQRTEQVLKLYR